MAYAAILASAELAKERGPTRVIQAQHGIAAFCPTIRLTLLEEERGDRLDVDRERLARLDAGARGDPPLRDAKQQRPRNRPDRDDLKHPRGLPVDRARLQAALHQEQPIRRLYGRQRRFWSNPENEGLWDEEMARDLFFTTEPSARIERIPAEIKEEFRTAFEIEPHWLIECAARRQKWIDMGQSLNLYLAEPSGRKLHDMYLLAWRKGLKTTYYLRILGASQIEKSTIQEHRLADRPMEA